MGSACHNHAEREMSFAGPVKHISKLTPPTLTKLDGKIGIRMRPCEVRLTPQATDAYLGPPVQGKEGDSLT